MKRYNIGDNVAFVKKDKNGQVQMTCNLVVKKVIKPNETFTESSLLVIKKVAKPNEAFTKPGLCQNKTSKTIIIATDETGNELWIEEGDVKPMLEIHKKAFEQAVELYRKELLTTIKNLLKYINPSDERHYLDVEEYYTDGAHDRIGKYCTPKDYPANYSLGIFYISNGLLCIEGSDIDDDREWEFGEHDLDIDELREIHDLLERVVEDVDNGDYYVHSSGMLTNNHSV